MKNKLTKLATRARRNRRRLDKNRPRLSVFRSERHIYAQIISDKEGVTLAAASSLEHKDKRGISAASMVGELIGKRAASVKQLNKTKIVFDRGGFRYHGRVKALAEAARANGLDF